MTSFDPRGYLKEENIRFSEPLSAHTTFRIGGPCRAMLFPENKEELVRLLKALREAGETFFLLGRGSNLLVSDEGYPGYVVSLKKHMRSVTVDGNRVVAESGALLSEIFRVTLDHSLTGFEFASGIPGTVGGAVFMNAGAYGEEMSGIIVSAETVSEDGTLRTLSKEELKLGYRTSAIQESGDIIVSVALSLATGDRDVIKAKADDLNERRKSKQPLEFPSAGSVFKRPEGYYAGKLIEDAGLKGFAVGDAEVSVKHAGFIINRGNATCCDVLNLIRHIQKTVKETSGVMLEPEIRMIGV